MNLEWEEIACNKWNLHERHTDEFGWRSQRTVAFVHEYRRHHKRRVRAVIYPISLFNSARLERKQFKTASEAKAWAVAMCQLSQ